MNSNRIFEEPPADDAYAPLPASGFYLMGAAPPAAPASSLQAFYQQLYEQAQRANQPAAERDLFAVMN